VCVSYRRPLAIAKSASPFEFPPKDVAEMLQDKKLAIVDTPVDNCVVFIDMNVKTPRLTSKSVPDCTCPAVLGYLLGSAPISITGLSPSSAGLSMPFIYLSSPTLQAPRPLGTCVSRFRLFRVRSPLLTESMFLSFPPGT